MLKQIQKNINYDSLKNVYIIVLLALRMFRNTVFGYIVPPKIDSIVFSCLGILGAMLIVFDVILNRHNLKHRYNIWLILFFTATIVSCLVNIKYGFFDNFKELVWTAIALFLLFAPYKEKNIEKQKTTIKVIQKILIVFCFIFSLGSIITFIFQFNIQKITAGVTVLRVGYLENRLFGIYMNPNPGSSFALFRHIIFIVNFKYE